METGVKLKYISLSYRRSSEQLNGQRFIGCHFSHNFPHLVQRQFQAWEIVIAAKRTKPSASRVANSAVQAPSCFFSGFSPMILKTSSSRPTCTLVAQPLGEALAAPAHREKIDIGAIMQRQALGGLPDQNRSRADHHLNSGNLLVDPFCFRGAVMPPPVPDARD